MTTLTNVTPLMPSRRIKMELDLIAQNKLVQGNGSDEMKTIAILAALKLCYATYTGDSLAVVSSKLAKCSSAQRVSIAKTIHPLLCAMTMQQRSNGAGVVEYLAQPPHTCGTAGKVLVLACDGSDRPSNVATKAEFDRLSA